MKNFIILKENRMKIILIKLRKTLHFLDLNDGKKCVFIENFLQDIIKILFYPIK